MSWIKFLKYQFSGDHFSKDFFPAFVPAITQQLFKDNVESCYENIKKS